MGREELKKLTADEIKARLDALNEQKKREKDLTKQKELDDQIKELNSEKVMRDRKAKLAQLQAEKEELSGKADKSEEDKEKLKQLNVSIKNLRQKLNKGESAKESAQNGGDKSKTKEKPAKPEKNNEKLKTNSDKDKKPKAEKPSDKSKPNSGNQEKSKDKKPQDEKAKNKRNPSDKKVVVDAKEMARLKEELKKTAEKRRIYKEEGSYELEAIEASKYSKLVEKINELEELKRLPKIKEEIAKLQEELKECAEKRRMYKNEGSYELEAIETSKYSKLVEKISQLEKPIKAYEKRQEIAKLKEELKACAEKRRMYKDEGSYELEAIEASKYSEIVAKIDELENGKREQKTTSQPDQNSNSNPTPTPEPNQNPTPNPNPNPNPESKDLEPHYVKTSETASIEHDVHTPASALSSLPVEPKEGRLKKMGKGFLNILSKIGRGIAKAYQATIGRTPPAKWLYNRYMNKAGDFKELPWENRILRRYGFDLEEEISDEVPTNAPEQNENEGTENNSKNEEQNNNEAKTKQRSADNLDRERIRATASSIIKAMNSVQSKPEDEQEEQVVEEVVDSKSAQTMENGGDPGKTGNTRREEGVDGTKFTSEVFSEEKEDNKSDLEKTKKKVKKGMKNETITFGGYEFRGMDKIIISNFMDGKKFTQPQLVTTIKGEKLWINPGSKELEAQKSVEDKTPSSTFDQTLRDDKAAEKVIEVAEEYHDDGVKRGEPIITVNQSHPANRTDGR